MDRSGFIFVLRDTNREGVHKLLLSESDPRQEFFARDVLVVRWAMERAKAVVSILERLADRGIVPANELEFECAPHELVHAMVDSPDALEPTLPPIIEEPRVRLRDFLGLSTKQAEQIIATEFRESISPRNVAAFVARSSATAAEPDERLLEAIEESLRQVAAGVAEERVDELFDGDDLSEERLIDEALAAGGLSDVPRFQLGSLMRAAVKLAVVKGMLATDPSLLQSFIARVGSQLDSMPPARADVLAKDRDPPADESEDEASSSEPADLSALFDAAWAAYCGRGDEIQDYDRARVLFEEAAERGSTDAMRMLGTMLRDGNGCRKNLQRAAKQFRAAADAGDVESWAELGALFGDTDPDMGLAQPENARKCWDRYLAVASPRAGLFVGSASHLKEYVLQAHAHQWPRQHRRLIQEQEPEIRAWHERVLAALAERPYSGALVRQERQVLAAALEWYLEAPVDGPSGLLAASSAPRSGEGLIPAQRFSSLGPAARERVFRCLCRIVHCDGRVDPRERARLEVLREDLGISERAATRLESEASIGSLQIGKGAEERSTLVDCMVEMALVDGHLDDRERALLMKVGNAIGLEPAQLEAKLRQG